MIHDYRLSRPSRSHAAAAAAVINGPVALISSHHTWSWQRQRQSRSSQSRVRRPRSRRRAQVPRRPAADRTPSAAAAMEVRPPRPAPPRPIRTAPPRRVPVFGSPTPGSAPTPTRTRAAGPSVRTAVAAAPTRCRSHGNAPAPGRTCHRGTAAAPRRRPSPRRHSLSRPPSLQPASGVAARAASSSTDDAGPQTLAAPSFSRFFPPFLFFVFF